MSDMDESGSLLDGILAVTHPELYAISQTWVDRILAEKRCSAATEGMRSWPTSFNSVQVIVNRLSRLHRDKNTCPGWSDLLATLGTYGEQAVLELNNLGVSVPYDSGTVAVICSRIIRHGVPKVEGDRVCYAWYMVQNVHTWFEMPEPGFADVTKVATMHEFE